MFWCVFNAVQVKIIWHTQYDVSSLISFVKNVLLFLYVINEHEDK
jgi:hypothetical protein